MTLFVDLYTLMHVHVLVNTPHTHCLHNNKNVLHLRVCQKVNRKNIKSLYISGYIKTMRVWILFFPMCGAYPSSLPVSYILTSQYGNNMASPLSSTLGPLRYLLPSYVSNSHTLTQPFFCISHCVEVFKIFFKFIFFWSLYSCFRCLSNVSLDPCYSPHSVSRQVPPCLDRSPFTGISSRSFSIL